MRLINSIFLGASLVLPVSAQAYDNPPSCPPAHYVAQYWDKIIHDHDSIYYPPHPPKKRKEFVLAGARYYSSSGTTCIIENFEWIVSPKFFHHYTHPCGYELVCHDEKGTRESGDQILLGIPKDD